MGMETRAVIYCDLRPFDGNKNLWIAVRCDGTAEKLGKRLRKN